MTEQEIRHVYDYSSSKMEMYRKFGIATNRNGGCLDNELLKVLSKIGITSKEQVSKTYLLSHWDKIKRRDYENNPKMCGYCGKKIPFERRTSTGCCESCAKAIGNKNRVVTEETKRKISRTLRIYNSTYHGEIMKTPHTLGGKCRNQHTENYSIVSKYNNGEITIEYIKENYPHLVRTCIHCGKEFVRSYRNCVKHRLSTANTCSDECRRKHNSNMAKRTVARTMANGTFKGWMTRNIRSYAEKFWENVLDNNSIKYISEYRIPQKDNAKNYFFDFYIELGDRKIDLEIDGKQHAVRQEHDAIRDAYVKSLGIEVYRIKWNNINSDSGKELMNEKIESFLRFVNI